MYREKPCPSTKNSPLNCERQCAPTIAGYVKKMDKARLEFVAAGERGRPQADKLAFEIEYLKRWQAQTLDEDATRALVRAALAVLGTADPKMSGRVIGQVMKAGAGTVAGRVGKRLGGGGGAGGG